jgi:hypothetical protein
MRDAVDRSAVVAKALSLGEERAIVFSSSRLLLFRLLLFQGANPMPIRATIMLPARPLAPRAMFARRVLRGAAIAGGVIGMGLALGAWGYHATENLPWLDATLNASMLLAGEGPLHAPASSAGKLFATVYALFSGVLFVMATGVLLAPVVHRFLHRFHLEIADDSPAG